MSVASSCVRERSRSRKNDSPWSRGKKDWRKEGDSGLFDRPKDTKEDETDIKSAADWDDPLTLFCRKWYQIKETQISENVSWYWQISVWVSLKLVDLGLLEFDPAESAASRRGTQNLGRPCARYSIRGEISLEEIRVRVGVRPSYHHCCTERMNLRREVSLLTFWDIR